MNAEVLRAIFTLPNILMMNIGIAAGTIIGAMPGLNVIFAIAILLPLTFGMDSISGMYLMLASYCGATFGGSITAILINTPGTPNAAATTFDGYPMAQKGKAADGRYHPRRSRKGSYRSPDHGRPREDPPPASPDGF